MAHHIDITYCRDLLMQIGAQLLDSTKQKDYARIGGDVSAFYAGEHLGSGTDQPILAQKYPDIRWLDHEL